MTVASVYLLDGARTQEQIVTDARQWCGQLHDYRYAWTFDLNYLNDKSHILSNGQVLRAAGRFESTDSCPRAICVTDWKMFAPPKGCECEQDKSEIPQSEGVQPYCNGWDGGGTWCYVHTVFDSNSKPKDSCNKRRPSRHKMYSTKRHDYFWAYCEKSTKRRSGFSRCLGTISQNDGKGQPRKCIQCYDHSGTFQGTKCTLFNIVIVLILLLM